MKPDPQFARHVDRIYPELEDLFAAGAAVDDLMEHPGWAHLTRLLEWEVETVDADLDMRGPLSQAEYAYAHGRRGGLRAMVRAAETISSRYATRYVEQKNKHERSAESLQEA